MPRTATLKKYSQFIIYRKLIFSSILIGLLSSLLALALKNATEHFETILSAGASQHHFLYFLFPLVGLITIFFLRKYLFKNKENKGIREVLESTESKAKKLPFYKIPSHFINGFLTVVFGGSTGIEVSTVVASATIGSTVQQKGNFFKRYQTELICAGISAGLTALFNSPFAGILFSLEVISKKLNKPFLVTNIVAVLVALIPVYLLNETALFSIKISLWHYYAIPYFILLGVLAGFNSVYLTKAVLFFKAQFLKINTSHFKVVVGALILGGCILCFPKLYGEGYQGVKEMLLHPNATTTVYYLFSIIGIIILKPIVTAITLASGGDGGVFAPSLFMGAFLGFFLATILNTYFNANVIPLNFIVIGMAAILSASIHAPFTALFLVCGITNSYTLMLPILMACFISKYTAKLLFPYTVYTYSLNVVK